MGKIISRTLTTLDGVTHRAVYSPCEKYRYLLERIWDDKKPLLTFIMLNPSTATEEKNDPTIERCVRRARFLGMACGGVRILNLFAYRATDPDDMKRAVDPIGPENDSYLAMYIFASNQKVTDVHALICGWGVHGSHMNREKEIFGLFDEMNIQPYALDWTKDGHPKHPLYISYDAFPVAKP